MKVAVSAMEKNLDAMVDPRFGRAAWLLIVDSDNGELLEVVDNSVSQESAQGAGIAAAALIADKGVEVLFTGRVGPKAMAVLEKANVRVVDNVSGIVSEAVAGALPGKGASAPVASSLQQTRQCNRGSGMGRGPGRCRR